MLIIVLQSVLLALSVCDAYAFFVLSVLQCLFWYFDTVSAAVLILHSVLVLFILHSVLVLCCQSVVKDYFLLLDLGLSVLGFCQYACACFDCCWC